MLMHKKSGCFEASAFLNYIIPFIAPELVPVQVPAVRST